VHRIGLDLDTRLARIARTRWHSPGLDKTVARFSALGEHAAIWLVIGAAGWAVDRRRAAGWRRATGTVAALYALNTGLKLVIRRPRPELPGLPALAATPTRFSFPSAHASTSFAGARAYARMGLPASALYGLATGMALSRLYLGVHYPSDVLVGAVLGVVLGGSASCLVVDVGKGLDVHPTY
jgi:membrane-associated phospholipid phosphatase